jgi:hypothetical protein
MQTDALQAWRDEGLRLLSNLNAPAAQSTEVAALIDQTRDAMAQLDEGREKRPRPLSRSATETAVSLASAFLAPAGLDSLSACSRAMKKLAQSNHLWETHTRRCYSEAWDLTEVGGASSSSALTCRQAYRRMERLWNPRSNYVYDAAPGIEEYGALVLVSLYRGSHSRTGNMLQGVFGISSEFPEVAAFDSKTMFAIDAGILTSGIPLDCSPAEFSVSVSLVRKRDGRCRHLITQAGFTDHTTDADDDYILMAPYREMQHAWRSQLPSEESTEFGDPIGLHTICLYLERPSFNEDRTELKNFHGMTITFQNGSKMLPTRSILRAWHFSHDQDDGWI